MNEEQFFEALKEKGIELDSNQKIQFHSYYELLVEWNEKMNLTAITDKPSVYLKHFYDSITAGFFINLNERKTICDVGAGAGFPSIPLKICFPNLEVTIVDSLNKRISFLENLADQLKLENVHFVHARAEDFGQNPVYREKFDIVTARAVARLSVLAELCVPLVKNGGMFVSMKGAAAEDELVDAEKSLSILGVTLKEEHSFKLPEENSDRHIFIFNKTKSSPKKYPRKPGIPNKSPIS
ncbi:16S rRNA (guanine(527)-N(7))-methyltransferase RsmG [Sporosarcina siberiensis]|uniref:Ribosomal RNA small subunit methyltransferase G n=1 Tax=Sporosarcina siberiensis TaxID=1365606 RepID=A0ABW4SGB8_9BACL